MNTSPDALSLLLGSWSWLSPMWLVALAAAYLYGRATGWKWTPQAWAFVGAEAAFLVAMVSPLYSLAHGYLFSAHMAQHLLLLLVVPLLVLLSLPAHQGGYGRFDGFVRFFGNPLVGWFMGTGAMWLWHVRTFCVASQVSPGVGAFQTASLLFMGASFWWPVFAPSTRSRMPALGAAGYLFTGCVGCTLLGVYLTFSPINVCPAFLGGNTADPILGYLRGPLGMTPKIDQQLGGLLMWVPACFIYMSAIFANLHRWYNGDEAVLATAKH